jgi:cellulose synthase/poly-beta-1,6-N-acetylglucosamine synthase-like glycosyltransferase
MTAKATPGKSLSEAHLLTFLVSGVLLFFNLRRLLFLVVATYDWLQCDARGKTVPSCYRRVASAAKACQRVLILVPLRNEVAGVPGLAKALLALDYPVDSLTIGLIDDGSTDGSGELIDALAQKHGHIEALHNTASLGKARALNAGLKRWRDGDIVVIYDADARPEPASLGQIVHAFDDPTVAAAGGLVRPANGLASPVATYAALERLVHQQITVRAKDRLQLAPAILGSNWAYRRRDLVDVGGFPGGVYLEDSHLTVQLARRRRRIRFLPDAVAWDRVPQSLAGYWHQHVRWGRGFHDVAAGQVRQQQTHSEPPSLPLRLELFLFSLGYLDRLALLLGGWLLAISLWRHRQGDRRAWSGSMRVLIGMIAISGLLPYAQMALVLGMDRAPRTWWVRLPLMPVFFAVDVAAALWALTLSLVRQPRHWLPTERT